MADTMADMVMDLLTHLFADLLANLAGAAPSYDDFVAKRQKFNQIPPVTVTVC